MSKELLISERPGESHAPAMAMHDNYGPTSDSSWPKASIGNYKGVMLCNRPNELGQAKRPERQGPIPFLSRVEPHENIGLNPCKRPVIV
jgi:hypothetical protein